jgi:hypothetical protein
MCLQHRVARFLKQRDGIAGNAERRDQRSRLRRCVERCQPDSYAVLPFVNAQRRLIGDPTRDRVDPIAP